MNIKLIDLIQEIKTKKKEVSYHDVYLLIKRQMLSNNLTSYSQISLSTEGLDIATWGTLIYTLSRKFIVELSLKDKVQLNKSVIVIKNKIDTITEETLKSLKCEMELLKSNMPCILDLEGMVLSDKESEMLDAFIKENKCNVTGYVKTDNSMSITTLINNLDLTDENMLSSKKLHEIVDTLKDKIDVLDVTYAPKTTRTKLLIALLPIIVDENLNMYGLSSDMSDSINKILYIAYTKDSFKTLNALKEFFNKEIHKDNLIIYHNKKGVNVISQLIYVTDVTPDYIVGYQILYDDIIYKSEKKFKVSLDNLTCIETLNNNNETLIFPIEFNSRFNYIKSELESNNILAKFEERDIKYKDIVKAVKIINEDRKNKGGLKEWI